MQTSQNKDFIEEKVVKKAEFNSSAGGFYWAVSVILLIVCFVSLGSMEKIFGVQ